MDTRQAQELLQKYLDGKCSPEEKAIFESWYNKIVQNRPDPMGEPNYKALHKRLSDALPAGIKRKQTLWPRIAAVAAILLIIGAGLFLYTSRPVVNRNSEIVNQNDIAPGKIGATLTLASGKKITLSDAKNGELAKEAGVTITKDANGQLVYVISSERGDESALSAVGLTNTLTTAKGETYQVRLPDGTLIWLNAASTLKYPASFAAHKNRRVELSGEGYFEVAKDKAHPFIVATDKQEVEVLGTHFNINSYADEPTTKTTLLEGSVRVVSLIPQQIVNRKSDIVTLLPNQQSVLTANNQIKVTMVDAELAIAWKNGIFDFKNTPLETIMKQVSRWYNVEIVYEDAAVKTETISGAVSRYDKVSRVLKALEFTGGVKFTISGRKIIVQSNK